MINQELSWETFPESLPTSQNERLLHELEETNRSLLKIIQELEENPPVWKAACSSINDFFHRYTKLLFALLNLIATFLWLSMLIYFTIWYLSHFRDDKDRHSQICDNFSLWPYISCIGAKQLPVFRGICITMAILISLSFLILCYIGNQITPGIWFRRLSTLSAVISSCALVALSFEPVDSAPTAHLVCTSIQIFAMGNAKIFDWISNIVIRRSFRNRIGNNQRIRPLEVSRWLKISVAAFGTGLLYASIA